MTESRVWFDRWGLFAGRAGSVSFVQAPGFMAGRAGRVRFVTVPGLSIAVFDTRDDSLPFDPEQPDAPGFWVGRYYVAFNRGRE